VTDLLIKQDQRGVHSTRHGLPSGGDQVANLREERVSSQDGRRLGRDFGNEGFFVAGTRRVAEGREMKGKD
jgi:hypothetical protein